MFEKIVESVKVNESLISETDITEKEVNLKESCELKTAEGVIVEPNLELIKRTSLESIMEQNFMKLNAAETKASETRPLTDEEKKDIKEKTNMSDATLDKCTIDENGVIHLKCDNEHLAGLLHEITGVKFTRKIVDINGVKIEVVVPEFESCFDFDLSEENIDASDAEQFKECNQKLKEAIEKNPELRKLFTEDQIQMIMKGKTPRGYTWHHDAERGKMQLVKTDVHSKTGHTGGKAIWGGGQDNR